MFIAKHLISASFAVVCMVFGQSSIARQFSDYEREFAVHPIWDRMAELGVAANEIRELQRDEARSFKYRNEGIERLDSRLGFYSYYIDKFNNMIRGTEVLLTSLELAFPRSMSSPRAAADAMLSVCQSMPSRPWFRSGVSLEGETEDLFHKAKKIGVDPRNVNVIAMYLPIALEVANFYDATCERAGTSKNWRR